MRTWVKDPIDRPGMYARRQRRVQSAGTNVQSLVLTTLNPDEIQSANLIVYPVQKKQGIILHGCQGGGAATRLTADQLNSGSNPDLGFRRGSVRTSTMRRIACDSSTITSKQHVVIAAIAVGTHLVSFRTQQLSRQTYHVVLRYASPREAW